MRSATALKRNGRVFENLRENWGRIESCNVYSVAFRWCEFWVFHICSIEKKKALIPIFNTAMIAKSVLPIEILTPMVTHYY